MLNILWLPSWYPNENDPSDGDFIHRHARAVSLYCKVHVIHVVKARVNEHPRNINAVNPDYKNLTEQIIYYKSAKTGIKPIDRLLSHLKYSFLYRRAITNYIKLNGKPNLVHVHVAMKAGLVASWVKSKWKVPYVLTEHWTGYYQQGMSEVNQPRLFKQLTAPIIKQASMLVPVSNDLGITIQKNVVNVPFEVIANVVDTEHFKYAAPRAGITRFIHVSYMNFQKNPEGILKACSLLKMAGKNFELYMIGSESENLNALAREYGLLNSKVFFKPFIPYAEVAAAMQSAHAFLLFSRFENLPCVILEALCCGLPVISSRVGGIEEVINSDNGILVDNEDVEELANAMQHVIENQSGYDRLQIASNASQKFNNNKIGEAYFQLYKRFALP